MVVWTRLAVREEGSGGLGTCCVDLLDSLDADMQERGEVRMAARTVG